MKEIRWLRYLPKESVYDQLDSPIGKLTIITSHIGLHGILWDINLSNPSCEKTIKGLNQSKSETTLVKTKLQLTEYFAGKRKIFYLPLVMKGTDFQLQVWNELTKIPYATTISYAEQAKRIGDKNKARAVGTTNGLNPISIIIPCHRVVGSDGGLVGFGGGVEKKAYLLGLEKNNFLSFD